jgi:hypothetical protein
VAHRAGEDEADEYPARLQPRDLHLDAGQGLAARVGMELERAAHGGAPSTAGAGRRGWRIGRSGMAWSRRARRPQANHKGMVTIAAARPSTA